MKVPSHDRPTLLAALKERVAPHLSAELNRSQLYVDFADSYQACTEFLLAVDAFLSVNEPSRDELESLLVAIDLHLLEHLAYHMDSMRALIPEALDVLGRDDPSVAGE